MANGWCLLARRLPNGTTPARDEDGVLELNSELTC